LCQAGGSGTLSTGQRSEAGGGVGSGSCVALVTVCDSTTMLGRVYVRPTVIATPVLQVVAAVIIGLFLIQVGKRLSASSQNPIVVGLNDGLTFLTS